MRRHVRCLALLLLASCAGAEDVGETEAGLAIAGPWVIPADTLAIGDSQYVPYTGAGPWVGPSACGGSLLAGSAELRDWLLVAFPQVRSIGGYSCRSINGDSSTMSVHATGRALDIMLPLDGGEADNDLGDPIGAYLIEHAEEIGIQYIIWDRWTWSASRTPGAKGRAYGGAHPHHDHLHVELSTDAAARRTPWFSGSRPLPDSMCGVLPRDGGVVEENDDCFTAYGPATYWRTEATGHGGSMRWTNAFQSSSPSNWARWHIDLEEGGEYAVEVYAQSPYAVNTATRYVLMHGDVEHEIMVDFTGADGWVQLGTFTFAPGGGQHLSVYDNTAGAVASDQHIPADAMRLVRVEPTAPELGPTTEPDPDPTAEPEPGPHVIDLRELPLRDLGPLLEGDPTLDDDPMEPFPHSGSLSGTCSAGGATSPGSAWPLGLLFAAALLRRRR
ncbi:MAG: extensin family protein [Sandaracinaceae bacterium]|nr:extensin family protein [Sandaracinaceae bacterium]